MTTTYCQICEWEGKPKVPAHRLTKPPTCDRHYELYAAGKLQLDGRPPAPDSVAPASRRHKEKTMDRNCTECGKHLHALTVGEVCRKCRDGSSVAGGGKTKRAPGRPRKQSTALAHAPARAGRKPNGASGDVVMIPLTPKLSAFIWGGVATLPPAQQAALLEKLSEE